MVDVPIMMLNQAPVIRWSQRTFEAPQEILHKGLFIERVSEKRLKGHRFNSLIGWSTFLS